MNPETSADRLNLLEDFGEVATIVPRSGRASYSISAVFNRGPRRVADLVPDGIAPIEIVGSDPWLLVRREDAVDQALANLDRVELESSPGVLFRVHTLEPDEDDGAFFVVQLIEGV